MMMDQMTWARDRTARIAKVIERKESLKAGRTPCVRRIRAATVERSSALEKVGLGIIEATAKVRAIDQKSQDQG
jgi:hypothetical protein